MPIKYSIGWYLSTSVDFWLTGTAVKEWLESELP